MIKEFDEERLKNKIDSCIEKIQDITIQIKKSDKLITEIENMIGELKGEQNVQN